VDYYFRFGVIWANFDKLLFGLALGLALAVVAILAGTVIGMVCAFAATGRNRLIKSAVGVYVSAIRNTPILVIVLLVFFALPQLGVRLDKYQSFAASLAVYAGAYLTEVFRAGLNGVPLGVIDAGRAIWLTGLQVAAYVTFPIMMRNSLPAMGTTFISLFKDTSLASVVTVQELMFSGQIIAARNFQYFTVYTLTAILYFSVGYPAAIFVRWLERLSARGYSRRRRRHA